MNVTKTKINKQKKIIFLKLHPSKTCSAPVQFGPYGSTPSQNGKIIKNDSSLELLVSLYLKYLSQKETDLYKLLFKA